MVDLVLGKAYCRECASKGRECGSCHRPLGERYYSKAVAVCDACVTKRENASKKRMGGASQSALKGSLVVQEFEPLPANERDLLMFLKDIKPELKVSIYSCRPVMGHPFEMGHFFTLRSDISFGVICI